MPHEPHHPSDARGGRLIVGSAAEEEVPGGGLHDVRYLGDGTLTHRRVTRLGRPTYTAVDEARGVLHTVLEHDAGRIVSARLDGGDGRSEPSAAASSGGALPCHLAVHPDGSHVFAAHYGDGVLAVFPTAPDGRIGTAGPTQVLRHTGRPARDGLLPGPHAHMALPSPDGRFVLCTDLGTDRVHVYAFDPASGRLSAHHVADLPPGRGPRHLAFHPSYRYAYLLNELSSTLTVCTWDASSGRLGPGAELPVRGADRSAPANYPAAVLISPDGRFVYTSNRGDDTVAVHAVREGGASLDLVRAVPSGGHWPRDLALSPDGRLLFCANQRSDAVTVFRVDPVTGVPSPTGKVLGISAPTSVLALAG